MNSAWTWRRLDELGGKSRPVLKAGPFGSAVTKDSYVESGFKVYGQQEVVSGNLDAERYYISKHMFEKLKSCAVEPGDILITMMGTVGNVFLVPSAAEPGIINPRLMRIVLDRSVAEPSFVSKFLESAEIRRLLERRAHGGTMPGLNADAIGSIQVPLPPLPEQRKIAEILRTWEEAIEKLEALRASNENRYKALARRFFEPCHPTYNGRPNTWREFELGNVFHERSQSGGEGDRLLSITMSGGVIDRDDVGRKDTSMEDKSNYKLILPGDIGYNTMRMWQGVSGLSTLRGIVSPAYTVVTPVTKRIVGRYAAHLFKSPRMVFDFERYSQGLTSDTWNLKFPAFSKIKVFLPPTEDQKKQADLLDTLAAESAVLRTQIEVVNLQKRGLMQKLLTGQWRVKVEAN
ncbi:restriction endonuclease subunit S [Methylosinus sp. KRF6]|uniref:restriction endonuclease subunit S n=1 Tax=Methylosinus sp. KRF6 TaxID=2846853 RepID=UPI001C0B3C34|nr:restriction endonuclease subunit S [Methylosinus sp. KRF6]